MAGRDSERLFTPAEVAVMLRVDPSTVSRWHRRGRLAAILTPGGHRRFRESDVCALMRPSESNTLRRATAGAQNAYGSPGSQSDSTGRRP